MERARSVHGACTERAQTVHGVCIQQIQIKQWTNPNLTDKQIWLWDEVKTWRSRRSSSRRSSSSTLNILFKHIQHFFFKYFQIESLTLIVCFKKHYLVSYVKLWDAHYKPDRFSGHFAPAPYDKTRSCFQDVKTPWSCMFHWTLLLATIGDKTKKRK